jgi:peptidoglycan/xylan/chitin deacetylase (PgdA/CDA1 family)
MLFPRSYPKYSPIFDMWNLTKLFFLRCLLAVRDVLVAVFHVHETSVLCYHSISSSDNELAVSPEVFERQLIMLQKSGAEFVSVDRIVAYSKGEQGLPCRAIVITFDDGYADFLTHALPTLEKYRVPACVFVVGDASESRARLGNDMPLLSSAQVETLRTHPLVTIGYHSRTHANLAQLSRSDLDSELAPQYGARYFAYPGGNYSDAAMNELQELGYLAAFSIKPDLVRPGMHTYLLPRSVVLRRTPLWMVRYSTTCAAAWYRSLRRALHR